MRRPGAICHERGVPSSQSRQVPSIHGADMAMKTDPRPRSIGSGACEINARFTFSSFPLFDPRLNVGKCRTARRHASTVGRGFERGRRRNCETGVYFARTGPHASGQRVCLQRHVGSMGTRYLSALTGRYATLIPNRSRPPHGTQKNCASKAHMFHDTNGAAGHLKHH